MDRETGDSGITDTTCGIGLAWTAVQVGSPAATGVVVAAGALPRALRLTFGGTLADRFDIRQVLIRSNIGQMSALAAVLVASTATEPSCSLLIAPAVILGACEAMYEQAAAAIARQIVHPWDLPAYTSVYQTVGRLGGLLGSTDGGVVVVYWSIQGTAVLNIVAFGGVLLVLVFGLRLQYPIAKIESGSILRSVVSGFTHLKDALVTGTLVPSQMLLNVFIVPLLALGITLRTRGLGLGPRLWAMSEWQWVSALRSAHF